MADEEQMGGSSFRSTENVAADATGANGRAEARPSRVAGAADAAGRNGRVVNERKLVAPSKITDIPQRHHPSRNSVITFLDNRSIMLYVTVVTEKRSPILANKTIVDCVLKAWRVAEDWVVGWYVIMPDHIHFFCAPATFPPPDFHRWMQYWKALATKEYWSMMGGSSFCSTENVVANATGANGRAEARPSRVAGAADAMGANGRAEARPSRVAGAADAMGANGRSANERKLVPPERRLPDKHINPPLFQRDCWDRQLRTGESYAQKWEYIRNNPVRKGLVANADDWPYQGKLNTLHWHEKV